MGSLYLVRHGQASFGADDYDQLSERGEAQAVRLGEYWRERGLSFDTVYAGTLKRHQQTLAGILQGLNPGTSPKVQSRPGLNEYDSQALLNTIHPAPLPKPDTPELYRQHFRLLRDGLTAWMQGRVQPVGMPSYVDFRAGVIGALDHVRQNFENEVLLVSSGGPIATAVAHVLDAPFEASIELNLRIRNTAVTEFAFNPKRHQLITYNTLPHLDAPPYRDWLTHA